MKLPDGISMCARYGGYHVYMAGPCFDRREQAEAYKAKLDRHGIKWHMQGDPWPSSVAVEEEEQ